MNLIIMWAVRFVGVVLLAPKKDINNKTNLLQPSLRHSKEKKLTFQWCLPWGGLHRRNTNHSHPICLILLMQLEWALRTFRLKNAGGNAERISYHPSPT